MPSPRQAAHALRFDRLRRGFGRLRVLDDVSGAVASGQVLLVSGGNGSGKSTLLRCLAGLLAPQSGTVDCRIDGDPVDVAARRRAVGYVAPDLSFYPELSVIENMHFFARLRGTPPEAAAKLVDRVGLPPGRAAGHLSSGMRQRLRWVWALMHRPPILLLDEPLQNLDQPGRRDVLGLLDQHLDQGGLAVVANPDRLEIRDVVAHLELGR